MGRPEDLALVLGGADTLWDDVARLEDLVGGTWTGLVVACNEAGRDWPGRLDHWVTFHPEHLERWKRERFALGHPTGPTTTWARRAVPELADRMAPFLRGGSSGLLAAMVARHKSRAERAVLCGIPIDRRPHYHDRDGGDDWAMADTHWPRWKEKKENLRGWARSMSGRTRDLLGEPTREWLGCETTGR